MPSLLGLSQARDALALSGLGGAFTLIGEALTVVGDPFALVGKLLALIRGAVPLISSPLLSGEPALAPLDILLALIGGRLARTVVGTVAGVIARSRHRVLLLRGASLSLTVR
jgi:hypothetical protein